MSMDRFVVREFMWSGRSYAMCNIMEPTFNCSNLVSKNSCRVSGLFRSGLSLTSLYWYLQTDKLIGFKTQATISFDAHLLNHGRGTHGRSLEGRVVKTYTMLSMPGLSQQPGLSHSCVLAINLQYQREQSRLSEETTFKRFTFHIFDLCPVLPLHLF